MNDVRNGTGRIIDDPSDVGGWINIESGTPCLDADHDGIPNLFEANHPNVTLEDYLSGIFSNYGFIH